MNIANLIRRACMLILFLAAFYTTATTITNLTFTDLERWYNSEVNASANLSNNLFQSTRTIALKDKSFEGSHLLNELNSAQLDLAEYSRATVIATGYTAGIESTGKTPSHPGYEITFSGVKVNRGEYSTIAADLDVYPLGTILYIPDYGYGIVADKGSAIKGNKIDLYYPTVEEVYAEWGKKEVDIYVIEIGNGQVTEEDMAKLNKNQAIEVDADKKIID